MKNYEKIVFPRIYLLEYFEADDDQQYTETNLTTHYCTLNELENYFANLDGWIVKNFEDYLCLDDPTFVKFQGDPFNTDIHKALGITLTRC